MDGRRHRGDCFPCFAFRQLKSGLYTLLCGLGLLAACTGPPIVPVVDYSPVLDRPEFRVVRAGDTVYSIAWEAGVDFRELGRWNSLGPGYVIKVGQKLRLTPVDPPRGEPSSQPANKNNKTAPAQVQSSTAAVPADRVDQAAVVAPTGWGWPATGPVVRHFSLAKGSKGIDIAGNRGAPVWAAASGEVVYAGSGLRGYGRLIIMKHDETFLSAYAHNRKIFVKEGDNIPRGYKIAEMGDSGVERVKLHFEIRRRGAPIDPIRYLPKR